MYNEIEVGDYMWLFDLFNKNIKSEDKDSRDLDIENYKMKDFYNAEDIFVGRFERVSSRIDMDDIDFGPNIETTKQKYFFEKIEEDDKIKYREIFTGFITEDMFSSENSYFNFPYICEVEKFIDYFPNAEDRKISKFSLIWAINDVNYKDKNKVLKK